MQPQSVIPVPLPASSDVVDVGRGGGNGTDRANGQRVWEELVAQLSRREHEVLQELVDGHSFAAGAGRLYVSRHTFRTHAKNILAKLGVHSSLEAVSVGVRAGMRPRQEEPGAA